MSANSEYFPERSCKSKKANVAAVTSSPNQEKKNQTQRTKETHSAASLKRYFLIIVLSILIREREGKGGGPLED